MNSSLTLNGVTVLHTWDASGGVLQGDQRNVGILVDDRNGSAQSFTMTGSGVNFFQKAGVLAEGAGLTVDLDTNNFFAIGGTTTQSLIELDAGATGAITSNSLDGIGANATGVRAYRAGSGVTVSGNNLFGTGGTGIAFAGTNAPVAMLNTLNGMNLGIADDFAGIGFATPLSQSQNSFFNVGAGYHFRPDPRSTNAWNVTGTTGPDDLEGGAGNDVFHVLGATSGSVFVGHGGIDTVMGYDGAAPDVAIRNGKWVVGSGAAADMLTGIEKVGIGSQTFDLVDRLGANIGGFQSIQAAIGAAHAGDVILAETGPSSANVQITADKSDLRALSGFDRHHAGARDRRADDHARRSVRGPRRARHGRGE